MRTLVAACLGQITHNDDTGRATWFNAPLGEIEEVRCDVNADFTEKLADSERFDGGHFWKRRRDFEKKWRDPDDVYIEVQRREEERKLQGLPPRLGVLPHSVVAEESPLQEPDIAKKKRTNNKAASNAKNSSAGRAYS